jgi:putative heme iron utilization protein
MAATQEERNFLKEAAGIIVAARAGSLATVSDGTPHVALVTPALTRHGDPLLLLSDLAVHTRHLRQDPACALLLLGAQTAANPQTMPRVTLICNAVRHSDPVDRDLFLVSHPYAAQYVNFTDFNFWRLIPKDAHYVGGFAAAARLDAVALHNEISAALAHL